MVTRKGGVAHNAALNADVVDVERQSQADEGAKQKQSTKVLAHFPQQFATIGYRHDDVGRHQSIHVNHPQYIAAKPS